MEGEGVNQGGVHLPLSDGSLWSLQGKTVATAEIWAGDAFRTAWAHLHLEFRQDSPRGAEPTVISHSLTDRSAAQDTSRAADNVSPSLRPSFAPRASSDMPAKLRAVTRFECPVQRRGGGHHGGSLSCRSDLWGSGLHQSVTWEDEADQLLLHIDNDHKVVGGICY